MIMLQFSGVLSNSAIRLSPPRMTWCCITQQLLNSTLSKADPELPTPQAKNHATSRHVKGEVQKKKLSLVETAMQNLKDEVPSQDGDPFLTVLDSIFKDVEKDKYSQKKSAKAFSLITNLMQKERIELSTILNDHRFIMLLDKLSQQQSKIGSLQVEADKTQMEFNGKNELANYVMILKTMSNKKLRNVPAIQGVVNVIVKSADKLNIKQASDVLYSLASMNYPDEMLIKKVCNDVSEVIPSTNKQSVIRSIITSLGMLQYKDSDILDQLSEWTVNNWKNIKSDFIVGLMYTLAIVHHMPNNEDQLMQQISSLKQEEMVSFEQWLSLVWSLTILNRVNTEQISSVLDESFVHILQDALFSVKLKLLNVNAAAKCIYKNYKGPVLAEDFKLKISKRVEKVNYIKSVTEPLKSLLPTTAVVNSSVDTEMGFLLDVECILDEKSISALLTKPSKDLVPIKIAIVIQGFHDFVRGSKGVTGINLFQCKLLESQGYKVLEIPYLDFNVNSKLIERLKYLKIRLSKMLESN